MIRIIAGTYGMRKGNRVIPVTGASGPIVLPDVQEKELVAQGIAEFVPMAKASVATISEESLEELPMTQVPQGDGLEDMKVSELRELAREYGLDMDNLTRKADLIRAIREAEAEEVVDDDDEFPQLEAEGII